MNRRSFLKTCVAVTTLSLFPNVVNGSNFASKDYFYDTFLKCIYVRSKVELNKECLCIDVDPNWNDRRIPYIINGKTQWIWSIYSKWNSYFMTKQDDYFYYKIPVAYNVDSLGEPIILGLGKFDQETYKKYVSTCSFNYDGIYVTQYIYIPPFRKSVYVDTTTYDSRLNVTTTKCSSN